jgi:hypothetical protein
VDLMRIEETCAAMHARYDLRMLAADPFQAALMLQRLKSRQVPCQDYHFVGRNLDTMASTLLDVFRSRRIRLYNHRPLIESIGQLSIVEKSYGHRLEATRTASGGHADLATALAIALPLAVEGLGEPELVFSPFGPFDDPDQVSMSPYERHMQRVRATERSIQEERDRIAAMPSNPLLYLRPDEITIHRHTF